MSESVDIKGYYQIGDLIEFAEKVETEEGNTYYRLPHWFQVSGEDFVMHMDTWPEDLAMFLTKAHLGGQHPRIQKPKIV